MLPVMVYEFLLQLKLIANIFVTFKASLWCRYRHHLFCTLLQLSSMTSFSAFLHNAVARFCCCQGMLWAPWAWRKVPLLSCVFKWPGWVQFHSFTSSENSLNWLESERKDRNLLAEHGKLNMAPGNHRLRLSTLVKPCFNRNESWICISLLGD